jgi:glutamine synthetase
MSYAPSLSWDVSARFAALDQRGSFTAEYIWVGGSAVSGADIRSKTRTMTSKPSSLADFPIWNFDGSSTLQAPGRDSEVYLVPVAYYPDPLHPVDGNFIVLCECVLPDGKKTPIPSNTRRKAAIAMEAAADAEPWFGIEQEYTLFERDGRTPLGWPPGGYAGPQGPYYCSSGTQNAYGRQIVDAHYKACMYAGIQISGTNAEVMPGQWEYQVGPCLGIAGGDQLVVSRFLLIRVCEEFRVLVSFDPKPIAGDWNGAGCHTNYSTKAMRAEGGLDAILHAISKLEAKHEEHIAVYGVGNERRLTGAHETAPISKFSFGVANRGASIRIPRTAKLEGKGYLEDRRPASNMDPYLVTGKIVQTTVLDTFDEAGAPEQQ